MTTHKLQVTQLNVWNNEENPYKLLLFSKSKVIKQTSDLRFTLSLHSNKTSITIGFK